VENEAVMGGIRKHLTFKRDTAHKRRTQARAGLMSLIFALAFSVIGVRLVDIGFAPGDAGASSKWNKQSTAVSRPDIVDRKGRILATDIQTGSLFADPSRIVDVDTAESCSTVVSTSTIRLGSANSEPV